MSGWDKSWQSLKIACSVEGLESPCSSLFLLIFYAHAWDTIWNSFSMCSRFSTGYCLPLSTVRYSWWCLWVCVLQCQYSSDRENDEIEVVERTLIHLPMPYIGHDISMHTGNRDDNIVVVVGSIMMTNNNLDLTRLLLLPPWGTCPS